MLLASFGCTELSSQSLDDGIVARTDNGAFTVLLEAEHIQGDQMGQFYLTVAMPDPSDPESVEWVVPGAIVGLEVLDEGEQIAAVEGLTSDSDGRHALESIPDLTGAGPWTFEFAITVDDKVRDTVVFHATP